MDESGLEFKLRYLLITLVLFGMTGGGYFRMRRWFKFSYLIFFILFFGCATAPNTHVAGNHDKIQKEKPSVEEVAAVELTLKNSYQAPLAKSPKKTSNSEIYSIPSKEKFPNTKIINARAGAKDGEEIIVEEGNGDKKKVNLLDTALDFYQTSQELWSRGEIEEAISALDEAYSFILKVDSESDPGMIQ